MNRVAETAGEGALLAVSARQDEMTSLGRFRSSVVSMKWGVRCLHPISYSVSS